MIVSLYRSIQRGRLDFLLYLRKTAHKIEIQNAFEEAPAGLLDTERNDARVSLEISLQKALADFLRVQLRNYPYWRRGHMALAEASLNINDIATAYASANACLALSQKNKDIKNAHKYLGICYLRRGFEDKAIPHLEKSLNADKRGGDDFRLKEELASAYMGSGQRDKALSVLQTIPEGRLSPEAAAVLSYLGNQSDN